MKYLRESWRRWIAWLMFAVIFAIACGFLSNWQFNRRAEALGKMQQLALNYYRVPVELDTERFRTQDEWLPVKMTGHFIPDETLLVRNRPLNGAPGYLMLIPFLREDGLLVGVESGWLPADERLNPPKVFPKPSDQTQTIWGRIRPNEPTLNRDAPAGQIATLNMPTLAQKMGYQGNYVKEFYVRLGEVNFTSDGLPKLLSRPQLTEGNHLSYAMQWIIFAIMAFIALIWAVRQELRFRRMAADPSYKPKVRKKVGDEDKAVEDAL